MAIKHQPLKIEGISKYSAVREWAQLPKSKEEFAEYTYTAKAQTFFLSRGISKETLRDARVYERTMWLDGLPDGYEVEVACFPVFKNRSLVNVKVRAFDFWEMPTFCQKDGAELYLIGGEVLNGHIKDVILCMDEIDRLSFIEAGYKNVICLPEISFTFIDESLIALFEQLEVIYLACHNNHEGIMVRDELSRRIGKQKCKTVNLPENVTTVNDVLNPTGIWKYISESERIEKLKYYVNSAKPLQIAGIYVASDFTIELNNLYRDGYPKGWKTGIENIDHYMTIYPALFSVLTAVPGAGKSTLLKCLYPKYQKWAQMNKMPLKMGLYSAEDKSGALATMKMIQNYAMKHVTKHENQMSQQEFTESKAWLNENFVLIRPEGLGEWLKERNILNANTLDGLLAYAEICVVMYGMNWLVIDNWSTIEKDLERGQTIDSYTSKALSKIVQFGDKFQCHVTLVAHPTKTERDNHGNHKRLGLYNISGSANFFNFIDIGIVLQRDEYRECTDEDIAAYYKKTGKTLARKTWIRDYTIPTQCSIAKVRDRWMGNYGDFYAWMDTYRGDSFVFDKSELHKNNNAVNYNDRIAHNEQAEEKESIADEDLDDVPF